MNIKIIILSIFCLSMAFALPSYAQQSMKETEKLRIQEEKRRSKMRQQAEKAEKKEDKSKKKGKEKQKISKKKMKGQVPKAAQRLSVEGGQVNKVRAKNRQGNQGVTKAAKMQSKSEKRRQKTLRR